MIKRRRAPATRFRSARAPAVAGGSGGSRTILRWSADGRALHYTAINNNVTNVWSQPLDGGPPRQLTNFTDGLMATFDWSRDGKLLACSRGMLLRDAVLITDTK